MFTMDVPYIPAQETPYVLAQAATPSATPQPDYILNTCKETESTGDPRSAMRGVNPVGMLAAYMENHLQRLIDRATEATIKLTLIEGTIHGKLNPHTTGDGRLYFMYDPTPDYIGNDKAVFMAEFEGKRYKIVVNLVVSLQVNENPLTSEQTPVCPPPQLIKVNGKPVSGSSGYDSGYTLGSLSVTFADLAGGADGQNIGEGANATITLDDNAAGNGWFIDTTPWDNSEYLPTSNPYEWVAKVGSAAEGKMDMLSVLLHEYGHALGIDHSVDGHDYMATTLTPGVRRMPSAEEMALMQQLVGAAKEGLAGNNTPDNAPNPFPTLPLGGGFGLAFLGRMRNSRFGGTSIDVIGAPTITQYAVAANATFTNLNTPAGWNSQGSVDITNGAATLSEVSTSQTRLSQVFMLNEQDRYLSFTLSGAALDNLSGAPDDAFEVALLDANTGLSVFGSNGLTRTDAIINLQGDGSEHAASSVTRINNADGSRTYRIDLTGVAKNTAVNLSFDLLGFGQSNSHVTLSDIRVSGLPQLHDEAATLLEDNPLTFDPYAQADAQLKPLLASHIVTGPTHGALAMNTDGTFSYTPDLNYFGADSFSYRLSDGPLDSNLATVSLTVTPVNDAPVAADLALTTAEDTALAIALGTYASDVDSTNITSQIVTDGTTSHLTNPAQNAGQVIGYGPAHGVLTQNADGSYSYTPAANYNGTDSFTYRVNDGLLDSNLATVTLAITSVNDAPVAVDTQAATDEDTPLNLNLLASASDVDGDVLTPVIIAGPLHGQLVQNADGKDAFQRALDTRTLSPELQAFVQARIKGL